MGILPMGDLSVLNPHGRDARATLQWLKTNAEEYVPPDSLAHISLVPPIEVG